MQNKNKVFFDMVMSIDGFTSPEGMELAHANDPEYKQWQKKWMELMGWVFPQQFFRISSRAWSPVRAVGVDPLWVGAAVSRIQPGME